MRRNACLFGVLMVAALLTGCVDRRYVITSDPPGAAVFRNGKFIGSTPVDDHFIYYGNYHYTLVADGYETLQVDQCISTPWYEYPPIDFFSENVNPFTVHDVRRFHYTMQPLQVPNSQDVLNRAQELRGRGQLLGPLP